MNNYLIEFALLHILFYFIYRLFLSKETQLGFLRTFLIISTVLALLVPLVELPNYTPINQLDITQSVSSLVLPEVVVGASADQSWWQSFSFFNWFILIVAIGIAIRLIWSISQVLRLYRKSESIHIAGGKVRHVPELNGSFTFFNWIFIDKNDNSNLSEIITHEQAHIKYGHSYDLMFFNLLSVPFWWLPTVWLAINELKQVHEYQADAYAIKSNNYNQYITTLIHNTLSRNGIAVTNSFNDTPITKRLNFMKKLKKDISPWKITSILAIMLLVTYMFSCQSPQEGLQFSDEIYTEVDETPVPVDGMNSLYKYMQANLKYPKAARDANIEGKVIVEFVVLEDGSVSNVIVKQGLGYGCDEEAVRIVENAPKWIPGKLEGKDVKTKLILPITFKLTSDSSSKETAQVAQDENLPTFPGGINQFFHYIQENMKLPQEAKDAQVEGKVFVEFTVDTDGSVKDAKVLRGIGHGCDEEALRVVKNSPDWIPVEVDGKPVATKMTLPILVKTN